MRSAYDDTDQTMLSIDKAGTMVLISDGNSEIDAHIRSDFVFVMFNAFNQIESSHKSIFFLQKKTVFLHAGTTYSELPKY